MLEIIISIDIKYRSKYFTVVDCKNLFSRTRLSSNYEMY